jgi:hypothetical protein
MYGGDRAAKTNGNAWPWRLSRSTGRHVGASTIVLEMPVALRIGSQSGECQIDCETANCTETGQTRTMIGLGSSDDDGNFTVNPVSTVDHRHQRP